MHPEDHGDRHIFFLSSHLLQRLQHRYLAPQFARSTRIIWRDLRLLANASRVKQHLKEHPIDFLVFDGVGMHRLQTSQRVHRLLRSPSVPTPLLRQTEKGLRQACPLLGGQDDETHSATSSSLATGTVGPKRTVCRHPRPSSTGRCIRRPSSTA